MRECRYSRRRRSTGRARFSIGNVRAQRGSVRVRYGCAFLPERFSCTSNDTAYTGTDDSSTRHAGATDGGAGHSGARNTGSCDGGPDHEARGGRLHFGPVTRVAQRDRIGDGVDGAEHLLRDHGHVQEWPELCARSRSENVERRGTRELVLDYRPIHDARYVADRCDVRRRKRARDLRRSVGTQQRSESGTFCHPARATGCLFWLTP